MKHTVMCTARLLASLTEPPNRSEHARRCLQSAASLDPVLLSLERTQSSTDGEMSIQKRNMSGCCLVNSAERLNFIDSQSIDH